jgi:hypothetical protein
MVKKRWQYHRIGVDLALFLNYEQCSTNSMYGQISVVLGGFRFKIVHEIFSCIIEERYWHCLIAIVLSHFIHDKATLYPFAPFHPC